MVAQRAVAAVQGENPGHALIHLPSMAADNAQDHDTLQHAVIWAAVQVEHVLHTMLCIIPFCVSQWRMESVGV